MRVRGRFKPQGETKATGGNPSLAGDSPPAGASPEGTRARALMMDPKDGDLFVCMAKPGETLVEACSDTDVQIVRPTCE